MGQKTDRLLHPCAEGSLFERKENPLFERSEILSAAVEFYETINGGFENDHFEAGVRSRVDHDVSFLSLAFEEKRFLDFVSGINKFRQKESLNEPLEKSGSK